MLKKSDFFKIGFIRKTHGIKGEMMLINDYSIDYSAIKEWLFFNLEECLVPFRIETFREIGDKNAIFSCERISDIETADQYVDTEIYIPLSDKTDTNNLENPDSLIDCQVINIENKKSIGNIIGFVDNHHNPLLEIETENENIYLPFVDEFIIKLDENNLYVKIPEGLLEL